MKKLNANAKQKAIIMDLDGTTFNVEHRVHYITGHVKDWKAFNLAAEDDTPNRWCYDMIVRYDNDWVKVLYVTGKSDAYRDIVINLFKKHDIPFTEGSLFMRKDGDWREDHVIKAEIYQEHIKDKYDVIFAVDDRERVAKMWRELGVPALQCAEGKF